MYLDLNHWIELSKARLERPSTLAPYREMYTRLQRLTRTGAVVTPLGEVHYSEIRDRISRPEQRNDVALTMAELSRYRALPPRELLLTAQMRRALATHFGVAGTGTGTTPPPTSASD